MSILRVILMPGAVTMDPDWSGLLNSIARHDPEAMACAMGRDFRLYGAISANLSTFL